jgi:WD40 repeat protein
MPAILFASLALALFAPGNGATAESPTRTDLYSDPLPSAAIVRLGTVRWRVQHSVKQMAFIPGDQYLATTGGVALSVWDVDTGRVVRTITSDGAALEGGFWLFASTPDGTRLLSTDSLGSPTPGAKGDRKASLLLWDFSSGKLLKQSEVSDLPTCVAIRPDSRVAACATDLGEVFLWDLEKNQVRRVIKGDQFTRIHGLSFAAEGKHLVVVPSEGSASQTIDVASGKLLKKVELGQCGRVALASGDGTVATYSHPDQLYLYDTSTGDKRRLPLKDKVNFLDLSFSPDGRTLLAMDRDAERVQFWDVAKAQLLKRLRLPGLASTDEDAELLLSGDGNRLASYEESRVVRIWDAHTGRPQLDHSSHVSAPLQLAFSTDGKEIASYAPRQRSLGGQLYHWDVATGKLLVGVSPDAPKESWPPWIRPWHLAPGGQQLAERVERASYLYDGKTGKRLVLSDSALPDSDLTFTPDGRALVTLGADQEVRLWDVSSGKLLRRFELEKKGLPISWLRFTDARVLATGEGWEKIHLWDAETGKRRATLTLPAEREPLQKPLDKWQTAFTPDGHYLFASNTTNLWVWDLVARREIGPFEVDEHAGHVVVSGQVAVSPDGRLMAWFDPALQLCLYEVCTGKIVHRFKEHYSSIAFAPSGWRLATGCNSDSSILIWDLASLFRSQPSSLKDTRPEALWAALMADDAVRAHHALWRLAVLSEADNFLAHHLQPVEALPAERLNALLADLGNLDFQKRQSAERALAAAGEAVRAALAKALTVTTDAEVRRRLTTLQARLDPRAPERLREVRAVLVLEARGTVEARRLLQRLAAGVSEARLTQSAKEALERLRR